MATSMRYAWVALAMTTLAACDKDEDNEPVKEVPSLAPIGLMGDGGLISGIKLSRNVDTPIGDYSSLHLRVEVETINKYQPHPDDTEKMKEYYAVKNLTDDYYMEKTKFIRQDYQEYEDRFSWPAFCTAYVNGEVSITCDKPLFGLEAGKNLSQHFKIVTSANCLPVGIEEPSLLYHFGDKLPDNMAEFFPMHAWVLYDYWLTPASVPEEEYEELTFKFTFPMIAEYSFKYHLSKYRGIDEELGRKEEVFQAECLVKFNWK